MELSGVSMHGICEIRWHGRGGQGAISSAQLLAHAAYLAGYKGVTSAPTFGAERRGAPVTASPHAGKNNTAAREFALCSKMYEAIENNAVTIPQRNRV